MQRKTTLKFLFTGLIISSLIISAGYVWQADKVIQVDIKGLLNARPVTTLTNGKLATWTKGVDRQNGYLTLAAAQANGETNPKAIADNPLIPATAQHPAILLHYSNKDGVGNQAKLMDDTVSVAINIPKGKYKDVYVCLTSAYGKSNLQCNLVYADGVEAKRVTVPDWYNDVPDNDPDFSYVVHDLGKWDIKNKLTEADHHNIHALNVHPDAKRALTGVRLKNLSKTYVLFWAATAVKI